MNDANESRFASGEVGVSADASLDRDASRIEPAKPTTEQSQFRLRNVLLVIVPVAVIAIVVLSLARVNGIDAFMDDLTRPTLVPVRGQLLYKGEPLRKGQIVTQPIGGRGLSALGWTDDEGRFTLQTDIRGNFQEGATVGEHRVAVTVYQMISAPAAPPLLTPPQYASINTSPLQITVGRDPDQNEFKLVLEGEPPSRPQRSKGGSKQADEPKDDNDAKKDNAPGEAGDDEQS